MIKGTKHRDSYVDNLMRLKVKNENSLDPSYVRILRKHLEAKDHYPPTPNQELLKTCWRLVKKNIQFIFLQEHSHVFYTSSTIIYESLELDSRLGEQQRKESSN
jgi:hypothetical protein